MSAQYIYGDGEGEEDVSNLSDDIIAAHLEPEESIQHTDMAADVSYPDLALDVPQQVTALSSWDNNTLLEKKARRRGAFNLLHAQWSARTFEVRGQTLSYYDSNHVEKGSIDLRDAACSEVPCSEADMKSYPFVIVEASGEKVYLNASSDEARQQCIRALKAICSQHTIITDGDNVPIIRSTAEDDPNSITAAGDASLVSQEEAEPDLTVAATAAPNGDELVETLFDEGSLGVVLRRRQDDGLAFIADINQDSQAKDRDVRINDELWSIEDLTLGDQFLDKATWDGLVELIKSSSRPVKLVWRRRRSAHGDRVVYEAEQPVDAVGHIVAPDEPPTGEAGTGELCEEGASLSCIPDSNSTIDDAARTSSTQGVAPSIEGTSSPKTATPSSDYVLLQSLLGCLKRRDASDKSKVLSSSKPSRSSDYMYLLSEGRSVLKRGDLFVPSSGSLWSKGYSKRHVILLSDLLIVTTPIVTSTIFKPMLHSSSASQEQFYAVDHIVDLQVCKLRSDAELFGGGESTAGGSDHVANSIKQSDDGEKFFQMLWPGGLLQFVAESREHKEVWVVHLFVAICSRVELEARVLGWRHQYLLGTMHAAVLSRDEMRVRELVALCELGDLEFSACIDAVDEDGYTPLHYACMLRMTGIIRALHEATADVTATDKDGLTPLHWVSLQLDSESLSLLSSHVFDTDYKDNEQRTPLYMACVEGRDQSGITDTSAMYSCVSCLLAHQPNVNLYDKTGFALTHYLSASWQYDTLDLLLEAGAHVNCRCSTSGMTALHLAAAASPIKPAVGAGVRISHQIRVFPDVGAGQFVPVEEINRPHGVATLRTLLKHGVKPNARDSQGRTALQILAENAREDRWPAEELADAVALLVSFGARFDDSSASLARLKNKLNMHGSLEAIVEKWGSLPAINGDSLGLG